MLHTLRRIVNEVNAAQNLAQALDIIVRRVKQAMDTDVCSVYLFDTVSEQYVLMATDGLSPQAVGHLRLARGEGLVSVVGETQKPLNLANAPEHPRFSFCAESGEAPYRSFLGVPIIHHRQVMGILIVQHAEHPFGEDEVSFLSTVSSQLAGAIAHADASGGIKGLAGEVATKRASRCAGCWSGYCRGGLSTGQSRGHTGSANSGYR